jgi:riboflavin synthase alpha subunit
MFFGNLSIGDAINLEKALTLNQGIDGHLVSGHEDGQGKIIGKTLEGESTRFYQLFKVSGNNIYFQVNTISCV